MSDTIPKDSEVSALDALAASDAAPRRAREPKPESKGSSRQPAPRTAPLERRLAQLFTTIALLTSAFDPVCGATIQQRADMLASAWNRAAQQNPKLKKAIERLLEGGTYGEVAFVTAMTLLPILKHHGLLPFNVEAALSGKEPEPQSTGISEEAAGLNREAAEAIKNFPQTVPQPNPDEPRIFIPE